MKKILSILLVLVTLLSLSSCSSAPKPKDDRVVLTISGEEIKYDVFRYVYLNTKAEMDGGDENYWIEHPEKEAELKEAVLETLIHNRSIQLLAKKHKIKLSRDEKALVLDEIEELKSYEDYKEGMESSFMTEYVIHYVQTFTKLWGKTYDYVTSNESGLIKNDDATVRADIPVNFRRIRYVMIEYDEKNKEDKRDKAEEILEKAQNGEDFVALIKEYCDDPSMVNEAETGSYYTVGQFVKEAEDAVDKLTENEISQVVELSMGFFVIQRLPLDEEYIEDNFGDFVDMYTARKFNEMVAELEKGVKVKTSKLWEELKVTDVK